MYLFYHMGFKLKASKRKILLMELLVILMLIPTVVIYYEYQVAKANNEKIMQEHVLADLQKIAQNATKGINANNPLYQGGH